ncbi:MAG: TolC family protein [Saprospiraceae bacterium]|nr:TolC family protein [Saprospiraceae bacterium]
MLRKVTLIFLCTLLSMSWGFSQESWSLEKCITYAQQNNLTVKQAQYQISNAELTLHGAKLNRYPSLNGSISGVNQFGRTIDPTTNTFNNQQILSNGLSLDARVTVYNGNRINNQIKQGKLDLEAAKLDAQATINDISLNVAAAYLNILLAEEQLEIANKALEQSQEQLDQTDKLIQAGTRPENERLDILAQLAQNEQTIIDAQNLVISNYLNLKQLLELDPKTEIRIQRPSVEVPLADPNAFNLEEIYIRSLASQPQVRAGEVRVQSAELAVDISRAGLLPSITAFGSISSNYSSFAKDFANPDLSNAMQVQGAPTDIIVNGVPATVSFVETVGVIFPDKPYLNQMEENFGQLLGLSLNIPIFNNGQSRVAMERARINVLNTQVTNKQVKNTLKANIQRAIADARSAKESWEAAQRSVDAAQAAFDNAQKRFDLGAINSLGYSTSRNTLDRSKVDLVRAKYQYIFNLKVVDFYLGKEITIN